MDSGLESKELRPNRGVHTHPTHNKEQMTFLPPRQLERS